MFDRLRIALERRLEKLIAGISPEGTSDSRAADVDALRAKGNERIASSDFVAAESWFRQALQANPGDTPSLVSLGFVLKEQGRLSEARVALRRAIDTSETAPDQYEMHYLLGQISEDQNDLDEAKKYFSESLRQKPDFLRACKDLCRVLAKRGEYPAIRELLKQSVSLCPQCADYRLWLSDICARDLDFHCVAEHLQAALDLGVNTVDAHMTLGAALCRIGKVTEAAQTMAIAQTMDPAVAYLAHYHLGYYHLRNGETRQGLEHMEQSIALRPDFLTAHSSILLALSHAEDDESAVSYRQAAERYARAVRAQIKMPVPDHRTEGTDSADRAGTKLRAGFVSGDLYRHPVAHFLEDVLRHLDRTKLHLVAYSNNPLDDEVTGSLTPLFDEWHSIRPLTDDAAAELIASHRIDVLLDLGGHTGENRLAVFARRPAPTQISWLGYFASTGLPEVDYIIGDPASTPAETGEWFSEQVYRMPHTRLCMSAPKTLNDIAVRPPPCLQHGYITFGSYQQATKITRRVLAAWAKVMQAVPHARLRIQTAAVDTPSMRDRLVRDLQQAGIDPSRVTLLGSYKLEQYLESHQEVDILLDTFPYPGGTTTAFALWMGVPTITLAGNTMLSRQGASMLQCVGLTDWIAQNESAYVDISLRMASDQKALAALRAELREKALKSPLFDAGRFATDFQTALFRMSRRTDA